MGICVGTAYAIITYTYVGMWERDLPAMYRKGLNVIGGRFIWLVSAEYLYKDIYGFALFILCPTESVNYSRQASNMYQSVHWLSANLIQWHNNMGYRDCNHRKTLRPFATSENSSTLSRWCNP